MKTSALLCALLSIPAAGPAERADTFKETRIIARRSAANLVTKK